MEPLRSSPDSPPSRPAHQGLRRGSFAGGGAIAGALVTCPFMALLICKAPDIWLLDSLLVVGPVLVSIFGATLRPWVAIVLALGIGVGIGAAFHSEAGQTGGLWVLPVAGLASLALLGTTRISVGWFAGLLWTWSLGAGLCLLGGVDAPATALLCSLPAIFTSLGARAGLEVFEGAGAPTYDVLLGLSPAAVAGAIGTLIVAVAAAVDLERLRESIGWFMDGQAALISVSPALAAVGWFLASRGLHLGDLWLGRESVTSCS